MTRNIFNIPIDGKTIVYDGESWDSFSSSLFEHENLYNLEIFKLAHDSFQDQFEELFSAIKINDGDSMMPVFSAERMLSALRACTHDLLRYATYHDIKFLEKQRRYDIAPAVRASVYAKWMATFRPYNFDCIGCERYGKFSNLAIRCNELASNVYASHALELKDGDNYIYIDEVLREQEFKTYMYTLRYRIKHQDSYSLFSRRLSESFK